MNRQEVLSMMNSLQDTYKLHNGIDIPIVGFGTWQALEGQATIPVFRR